MKTGQLAKNALEMLGKNTTEQFRNTPAENPAILRGTGQPAANELQMAAHRGGIAGGHSKGFIGDLAASSAGGRNSGCATNHRSVPVKFVACEHIAIASLSLNRKATQDVLTIGEHDCGVEACPVPRSGKFQQGLKDVESEMAEKADRFWVRHTNSKARYCVVRAGRTVAEKSDTTAAK